MSGDSFSVAKKSRKTLTNGKEDTALRMDGTIQNCYVDDDGNALLEFKKEVVASNTSADIDVNLVEGGTYMECTYIFAPDLLNPNLLQTPEFGHEHPNSVQTKTLQRAVVDIRKKFPKTRPSYVERYKLKIPCDEYSPCVSNFKIQPLTHHNDAYSASNQCIYVLTGILRGKQRMKSSIKVDAFNSVCDVRNVAAAGGTPIRGGGGNDTTHVIQELRQQQQQA